MHQRLDDLDIADLANLLTVNHDLSDGGLAVFGEGDADIELLSHGQSSDVNKIGTKVVVNTIISLRKKGEVL